MIYYAPGDTGRAICNTCCQLVTTTFVIRDVPFNDGIGGAKNILVAACNTCGETVGIPGQSAPFVRAARDRALGGAV